MRRVLSVAVAVFVLAATPLAAARSSQDPGDVAPQFVVGIDDDHSKWLARPGGLLEKYRDLGVDAVRVTIGWKRGQAKPNRMQGLYLHRAASLVARGQRVLIAVFGRPSEAPVDARSRRQYCDFLHHIVLRIPFRDVQIWNEANSPAFWPQSVPGSAEAYESLLATCWRRLHSLRRDINVISTTAMRHDPAGFVRAVGAAYRSRKRAHPLVDTFGHNPYPDNASEPPWVRHADAREVGMGDLDRLLAALRQGFAGTRQPLPGEGRTTIWYLEVGFQTAVPREKRRYYYGQESDPFALPPLVDESAEPWVRDQARQVRDALLLARCQPQVGAFFNFLLLDEDRLHGWQSGLLWRDGTEKPAYRTFKESITAIGDGEVACATVPGAGGPVPAGPVAPGGPE